MKIMELVAASDGSNAVKTILWNNEAIANPIKDKFPSKVIFKQMLDNVRARFMDIKGPNNEFLHLFADDGTAVTLQNHEIFNATTGARMPDQILWHKIPFMVNDMIFFRLRITAATDQEKMTNKIEPIAVRDYRIRLTIVDDTATSVSDWTTTGWDGTAKYANVGEVTA
jgi:hypothetical protein